LASLDRDFPKASGRMHRCHRRHASAAKMMVIECLQVEITNAVSIGCEEATMAQVPAGHAQARTGLRDIPRMRKHYPPILLWRPAHNLDRARAEVNDQVLIVVAIIEEIISNHLTLVSKAKDEVTNTEAGINFHDMPKNRTAADFN